MKSTLFILLFLVPLFAQVPVFTRTPSLVHETGNTWRVDFAVDRLTDVAVTILNLKDSSVVVHLAGGMLGPKAPSPLAPDSLHQRLAWDGRDDLGRTVADTSRLGVRVQAGMKVALQAMAGDNPYAFGSKVMGLAQDTADGSVYIFGTGSSVTPFMTIRKYDRDGRYLKTVFPFPGNLTADQVRGYGINQWSDGHYSPAVYNSSWAIISSKIPADQSSVIFNTILGGELTVFNLDALSVLRVRTDGSLTGTGAASPLITSPAGPKYRTGPRFLSFSPDRKVAYLSGFYEGFSTVNSSTSIDSAMTTGFWRDGQVFKINLATGAAVSLLALDSVPGTLASRKSTIGPQASRERIQTMAAIHGTAADDSGHVFVCDRLHQRLAVYDTAGRFLNALPVENPDLVEINKYEGSLYVLSRSMVTDNRGHISLRKFSGWRPGSRVVDSLIDLTTELGSVWMHTYAERACMIVQQAPTRPRVWVSSHSGGSQFGKNIWIIDDNNGDLGIVTDFSRKRRADFNSGFDRIELDDRTETVYINNALSGIYKLEDWGRPDFLPCSTSANKPLSGMDMAVGFNNLLYVREQSLGSPHLGPVRRYSLSHLHAPAPFANSGTNLLTPFVQSRADFQLYGDKGMHAYFDGEVSIMAHRNRYLANGYFVAVLGDSTAKDTMTAAMAKVDSITPSGGGVRYDKKKNLYFGAGIRPADHVVPVGFGTDRTYNYSVGSVLKFAPGVAGYAKGYGASGAVSGADRVYAAGCAPFRNSTPNNSCVCHSPRFDVDLYGRLFVPNAVTNRVTILDNEGNEILHFGTYGNIDSRGNGSLVPLSDIALGYPTGVAASDRFIYVADMLNARVVRAAMDYALDNMPGLAVEKDGSGPGTTAVSLSLPNPCMPGNALRVRLSVPGPVSLTILDPRGREINRLFSGRQSVPHAAYAWDGRDQRGIPVAPGLYLAVLEHEGRRIISKTVLFR